jgi:hypothetical protein
MDFTEVFPGNTTRFSTDGQHLAHIVSKQKIAIRNVDSLQVLHLLNANCPLDALDWSCDSQLILGVGKHHIKVWKLTTGNFVDSTQDASHSTYWTAQIDVEGCSMARFSPTGHNVMVWDEHGVRTLLHTQMLRS